MEKVKYIREIITSIILGVFFLPYTVTVLLIKLLSPNSLYEKIRRKDKTYIIYFFEVIFKLNAYKEMITGLQIIIGDKKIEKRKYGILEYIVESKIRELYISLFIFQISTVPLAFIMVKQDVSYLLIGIVGTLCYSIYIATLKIRFKNGLYGTNESEAREILRFMLSNKKNDIFKGPGGKRFFFNEQVEVTVNDLYKGIEISGRNYGR